MDIYYYQKYHQYIYESVPLMINVTLLIFSCTAHLESLIIQSSTVCILRGKRNLQHRDGDALVIPGLY